MKLKTKFQDEDFDLGEVVEANVYYGGNGRIKVIAEPTKGGMITFYFETLKGMNEMFEDYEEPKGNWTIDPMNENYIDDGRYTAPDELERYEELGLKFNTKEEAEKALEKLKAWKRLKDKGFEFEGWYGGSRIIHFRITSLDKEGDCLPHFVDDDTANDLDLLFGGEE